MLSKKHYIYTLVIAIVFFCVVFIGCYVYMKNHSWHIGEEDNTELLSNVPFTEMVPKKEICILPQTRITLKNECKNQKFSNETRISTFGLLGLTQEELEKRFEDYTVETFNEKQVILVKQVEQLPNAKIKHEEKTYVLGVEGQYVCIKEKDSNNRPVKMDYEVSHFSKYVYSLLLNEEIEITRAQKETLLLKPSRLQSILQGYMDE